MNKVVKSDDEWRALLTAEEFEITRKAGTERAFTGIYNDCKTPGIYNCKCCDTPLFDAATKYDSGSGWPSFYAPIDEQVVIAGRMTRHGVDLRVSRRVVRSRPPEMPIEASDNPEGASDPEIAIEFELVSDPNVRFVVAGEP